ncbi:MAG: LacI family transcriptional regulator [Lachnospiraceae bacterium]|nr:LacI family transcriptional regulator [Lachnospiraceae bacterium]
MTIKDIAKLAGVGVSTVSRAINDDPGIALATKKKVLKIVKEYNYIPNNSARNLKMTESNTIALLVRGIDNYFFLEMFGYIQRELESRGYDYLLHAVGEDEDISSIAMELSMEKRLKGLIILGGRMGSKISGLSDLPIPYVLCTVAAKIGQDHPDAATVGIDDEKESAEAVGYLIRSGHKRIAIVAGHEDDPAVGAQRLAGYKRALTENGLEIDESLIGLSKNNIPEFSAENGYQVAKELIQRADFTAIYCISDLMAMGCYKAIAEAGKKIPDDISVIGFDGIDLGRFLHPSLTTMVQPREEMAVSAVELLNELIEENGIKRHITYEAKLLTRDSVRRV